MAFGALISAYQELEGGSLMHNASEMVVTRIHNNLEGNVDPRRIDNRIYCTHASDFIVEVELLTLTNRR